jgi:hypothetical protein
VICSGCGRDNRANRRYCGACGCNLEPACGACGFANDREDRFCGGCGAPMAAAGVAPMVAAPAYQVHPVHAGHEAPGTHAAALHTPAAVHSPTTRVRSATPSAPNVPAWQVDELAGLFTPQPAGTEPSDLPEIGIAQDDLDRLFGAGQ